MNKSKLSVILISVFVFSLIVGFFIKVKNKSNQLTSKTVVIKNENKQLDSIKSCPEYEISAEDKIFFDEYPKILYMLNDRCEWLLKRQQLVIGDMVLEAVFSGGINCVSCHAQTLFIFDKSSTFLSDKLIDPRVKVVGNSIVIKSQLGGGGAPSPNTIGNVKKMEFENYKADKINIKEYKEEYTLRDYEGKE